MDNYKTYQESRTFKATVCSAMQYSKQTGLLIGVFKKNDKGHPDNDPFIWMQYHENSPEYDYIGYANQAGDYIGKIYDDDGKFIMRKRE